MLPERKKNRLVDFDYSSPGYYFITICTDCRFEYFGDVKDGKMVLSKMGEIAEYFLKQIPFHYKNVLLDEFVIMPNHIHAIIIINESDVEQCVTDMTVADTDVPTVGTEQCSVPTPVVIESVSVYKSIMKPMVGLLSKIIKSFKDVCTKNIKNKFGASEFCWQRSFYDCIIRNETAYNNIKFYIQNNPNKWEQDRNNKFNLYM